VRQFVEFEGWRDGKVSSYMKETDTINVVMETNHEEQWSLVRYNRHADEARIKIADVGYRFVEPFLEKGGEEFYNGEVVDVRIDGKRKCKYNVGSRTYIRTLERIQELSEVYHGNSEEKEYLDEETDEDLDDEEETPYTKKPSAEKATHGRFFRKLLRLSLNELKSHQTARSAFAQAMKYPVEVLEERFSKVTLDGKPGKVIPWSSDAEEQEIYDLLKRIDSGFDPSIRSWGQFKSKMPILYEFFKKHVRHHDYLTEWTICELSDCVVCRKFGNGLRIPNTPLAHYTLLRPMDRPVNDRANKGHFVPAGKTAGYIEEKKFTFEKLKAELPKREKDDNLSKVEQEDKKADKEAGGSTLFKGEKVRDAVKCVQCSFPRSIYSMNTLNNRTPRLSREEKKTLMSDLENFKETYICGDTCQVDGFVTKKNLRCGDFVESQYFTFARGTNDWQHEMCCYCCNVDDVLAVDEMKTAYDTGGKQPLRLCKFCVSLNIQPPTTNASTNFVEKKDQERAVKKRKQNDAVSKGLKRKK